MKEQTRNTEVQMNEEEIDKLWKIIQNYDSKYDQNLENIKEKMQESIDKI